jgi:DNA-binding NtrC family response regulator
MLREFPFRSEKQKIIVKSAFSNYIKDELGSLRTDRKYLSNFFQQCGAKAMKKVLIVDDDAVSGKLLKAILQKQGWQIFFTETPEEALHRAETESFDLLISDINLNADKTGLDLLRLMREKCPVILITGYGTLETAVEASREGAFDIISKPFQIDEVVAVAKRALEKPSEFENRTNEPVVSGKMTGRSPAMLGLYKEIARVAPTRSTVLILGESGTGKELVAKAIHENSLCKDGNFVAVNCGALTETLLESELFGYVKGAFTGAQSDRRGLWEEAAGGTLFLDEIGEISLPMQVKLLRALQEGEIRRVGSTVNLKVNTRVVAATNRDLETEIQNGRFREDLFYRLNVFALRVPPLRERKSDIPLLAEHFLQIVSGKNNRHNIRFSEETLKFLTVYDWRGNVRELESVIEYAALRMRGQEILPEDLPPKLNNQNHTQTAAAFLMSELYRDLPNLDAVEKRYLLYVLEATGGNRTRTAEILGVDRRTFYRMAERFEISLEE